MSFDDVDPFEMDGRDLPEIDDPTAERLLSGSGRDLDPALADVLGDLRVAFRSESPVLGRELTAVMTRDSTEPVVRQRFARMRTALVARIAAVTALSVASTGGLAAAGALPDPAQDAVARAAERVGFALPANGDDGSPPGKSGDHPGGPHATSTTTTTPDDSTDPTTPTSHAPAGAHGAEVSAVARDESTVGCEHGRAVSAVASGKTNDEPCPPQSTASNSSTTTTAPTPTTIDGENPGGGAVPPTPGAPISTGKPSDPGRPDGLGIPGGAHPRAGAGPHGN
jgi:hypothetical protein